jgi:hypothetical protein
VLYSFCSHSLYLKLVLLLIAHWKLVLILYQLAWSLVDMGTPIRAHGIGTPGPYSGEAHED